MSIQEHPRLCLEIPRGTERYNKIKALRSATERTNSAAKQDIPMLNHPYVLGALRSAVLAQMTCIAILLKKAFDFIIRVTLLIMSTKSEGAQALAFRKIPLYLKNLALLE